MAQAGRASSTTARPCASNDNIPGSPKGDPWHWIITRLSLGLGAHHPFVGNAWSWRKSGKTALEYAEAVAVSAATARLRRWRDGRAHHAPLAHP